MMTLAEQAHYRKWPIPEDAIKRRTRVSAQRQLYLFIDNSILIVDRDTLTDEVYTMYILPGDSRYAYYRRRL